MTFNADIDQLQATPPCEIIIDNEFPEQPAFQCGISAPTTDPSPNPLFSPDLLITVNFTSLGQKIQGFKSSTSAVTLLISLSNQTTIGTQMVIDRTLPLALIPGVNLIGAVTTDIRQVFSKPSFAALGLFQVMQLIFKPVVIDCNNKPLPDHDYLDLNVVMDGTIYKLIPWPLIHHSPAWKYFHPAAFPSIRSFWI